MKAHELIELHRDQMIRFLEMASPASQGDKTLLRFTDRVEADLERVPVTPENRAYFRSQDVFFYCLSKLEELADIVRPSKRTDPYVQIMLDDLKDLVMRLKDGRGLPSGMEVGWFGDFDDIDDMDDIYDVDEPSVRPG